jgi:hypothetical protein
MFNFGKTKKKEYLLNWQKIVMTDSPDKLVMTEEQLKHTSEQQAENDLRIFNDCLNILKTTTKPDTFFSRLDLAKKTITHLVKLEPYVKFSGIMPTEAVRVLEKDEQQVIYDFIARYFGEIFDKAEKLKTDAGKKKRYQSFYDSLTPYFDKMNEHNRNYVQYKYNSAVE